MTGNQRVAFNLRRARREADLTQTEAAELLEPYLGKRWSKASFSVADRTVDRGTRKREFDANEILAFSVVFDKPPGWFFSKPKR